MSDYVREKVLRYPIEPSYFGVKSLHDLEEKDEYKDIVDYRKEGKFSPAPTIENFIDYVLYTTYGEDSGDYGKVRELYDSEKAKYLSIFQKLIPDVNMDKVRLVDFCWYNCSEAPNYYDPREDEFYNEV